jgi:hypothetical protein
MKMLLRNAAMASAHSNIHQLRPKLRLVSSNEVPRIFGVARFPLLEGVSDCGRNYVGNVSSPIRLA